MRTLVAAALTCLAAGCAPHTTDASSQEAIVGGTSDSADEAVVFVQLDTTGAQEACTGSLIAPRVVLTAAHCFDDDPTPTVGFSASYGGFVDGGLGSVDTWYVNPEYTKSDPLLGHDNAVIILKSDASVAPLPYHSGAPDTSWVGQTTKIVGYGITSATADDVGTRRTISIPIASYTDHDLVFDNPKTACHGDSGGPAMLTLVGVQTLVGVASTTGDDCVSQAYYGRIDSDIDFIDANVAASKSSGSTSTGSTSGTTAQMGGCATTGAPSPGNVLTALFVVAANLMRRRRRA